MRKIIFTLLFLLPLLSGCVSVDSSLTINKDKSAQIQIKMASDKQARPLELQTMKNNFKSFIDNSYEVKDDSDVRIVNVIASKGVQNIHKEDIDLSSLGFVSKLASGRFVEVRHNFFVTSYNIDMTYDFDRVKNKIKYAEIIENVVNSDTLTPQYLKYADTASAEAENLPQSDFAENFDKNLLNDSSGETANNMKEIEVNDDYKLFDITNMSSTFSVKLPYFASYNNADKADGYIYTWILSKSKPTEIVLQYVVYSGFSIGLLIITGILLLIYISRRIYRHDTLKRIGNNN